MTKETSDTRPLSAEAKEWIKANRDAIESSNAYVEEHGLPLGQQWVAENAEAFACWNGYVEKHGLPLAKYNQFLRKPEPDND